jgi:tRNA nucleotidyltransferase/poly(A) polymerase
MLVRMHGHVIHVATFRTDGVYSDSRHPDSVVFSDAQHDAGRRDFTINGLFENPLSGEIIDYVGGRADLEARLIRGIGDPHARLREDRLRMLRAIRFAARFAFAIEEETAEAIRQCASELTGVSRERIGEEVRKMLSNANRAVAAWEIQYLDLDAAVLTETSRKTAPTRLGRLPDDAPYPTALAAWLLDRHIDGDSHFDAVIRRWRQALMLSNEEADSLEQAIGVYEVLMGDWDKIGVARQKRLASSTDFNQGLALVQSIDRQRFVDIRRQVIELAKSGLAPQPLIDGSDLIELGHKPGPIFSRILEAVYDAQLEGHIADKPQALELVGMLVQGFGQT